MASSAEDSQRSRADDELSRLTRMKNLEGGVVPDAVAVECTAVTEAGVVAAAPLEGKLAGKQSSQEQAFSTKSAQAHL
eukprot:751297-Hanusia_phi.AAC.1